MSEMIKTKIQDALDGMVRPIVERFHPDKIILFGSCARGEFSDDSDIDILIVMPVEGSRRKKANEIDLALADRIVPVDLLVLTPELFVQQREMIGTVVREAAREGIVIYEKVA